jgi:hypothetical protein
MRAFFNPQRPAIKGLRVPADPRWEAMKERLRDV